MTTPSLDEIARTINGPNDATHIGHAKLRELQDIRWGQLKSQEQAGLLRAARYVLALFQDRGGDAAGRPPPLPPSLSHPGADASPQPAPIPIPPVDRASEEDVLRIFRQFVCYNATQWRMGAGDHHHPMWGWLAERIDSEENKSGPDWQFIQPENRERHSVLLERHVENGGIDAHG